MLRGGSLLSRELWHEVEQSPYCSITENIKELLRQYEIKNFIKKSLYFSPPFSYLKEYLFLSYFFPCPRKRIVIFFRQKKASLNGFKIYQRFTPCNCIFAIIATLYIVQVMAVSPNCKSGMFCLDQNMFRSCVLLLKVIMVLCFHASIHMLYIEYA